MRKLTTEEFIAKAREVHGDKYDYSKTEYSTAKTKVCIICPKHGDFWQKPLFHLQGCGCPKCGIEKQVSYKRSNLQEFILKSIKSHGDKYDYSKVEYKNNYTKVCIICPTHGEFWQKPVSHLMGLGCIYCRIDKSKKDTLKFIEEAQRKHDYFYNYSKTKYISAHKKVCIICPIHGEFWQEAKSHLLGCGCPQCGNNKISEKLRLSRDEFIERANLIHNSKYDYSKVNYINGGTKVCIICPTHGEFIQEPSSHLSGCGCPKCKSTHGELRIENYLKQNKIEYQSQYPIKLEQQMFSRNNLKVDFYLPDYNTIIEFNGVQHYKFTPMFHKTEEDFEMQIERDNRLKQYCRKHKIQLIEIKYDQIDQIDKILDKKLKLNNKQ